MSLSDLASLGSFVSGVAVLLSLVFLTLQLRQGNINQRALIQMGRSTRVIDGLYRRTDPRLIDVMLRGNKGDTSMSPDDIQAYLWANYAAFQSFEDTFLQDRSRTIDPDAWRTAAVRLKGLMAAPGYRVCWKKWRVNFRGDFAEAVDQMVVQSRLSVWEELSASWASDVAEELRLSAT